MSGPDALYKWVSVLCVAAFAAGTIAFQSVTLALCFALAAVLAVTVFNSPRVPWWKRPRKDDDDGEDFPPTIPLW